MYCSRCGFQNNQGEVFCKQCGTKIEYNNQVQNQFSYGQQQNPNYNQSMNNQVYSNPNMNIQNNSQSMNNFYNQQVINKGVYRLTLTRPKAFVGSLIKYKIFIDNNEVGTIKNGETVVLNVSSGNHTISFNKTMVQNININSDITADVIVIAGNKFGLSNVRDNNGINIQNNEMNTESVDKIIKSAKGPLKFSCVCIALTFILLFTVEMVISPWMYGISIGYSVISLSSIKNNKQILHDKYSSLIIQNIISIIISVIGIIISGYLMI